MEPIICIVSMDADCPTRVHLPRLYSDSYLTGKAEAIVEGDKKTSTYDYALELKAVARRCAERYHVGMVLHIVTPATFASLAHFLSYGDFFLRFPYAFIFPVGEHGIAYNVFKQEKRKEPAAIVFPDCRLSAAA